MSLVSSAAHPTRRLGFRRRLIDWRIVGFTAASGVMFVAMLARPF